MPSLYFITLVIGAFFGAVGAYLLKTLLRYRAKWKSSKTPLAVYDCAEELGYKPGVLWHGWGSPVRDEQAASSYAWEHSAACLGFKKEHTIYGPYSNDLGQPGFYTVKFRVRGVGFLASNEPILVLDVTQAPFGGRTEFVLFGQRVVKARELDGAYKDFSIDFYTSGGGIYEYRCSVLNPDRPQPGTRILFDTIKVYRHIPIWEVI